MPVEPLNINALGLEDLQRLDPESLTPQEREQAAARWDRLASMRQRLEEQRLDERRVQSPATVGQRFMAGLPATPRDRLATVRRDYPTAEELEPGSVYVDTPEGVAPWTDSGPAGAVASAAPELGEVAGASAATLPFARRLAGPGAAGPGRRLFAPSGTWQLGARGWRGGALRLAALAGLAGAGAVAGRGAVEGAADLAGSEDTRTPEETASDYGTTFGLNAGLTGAGELALRGGAAALRPLGWVLRGPEAPALDAAFTRLGVRPTAGTVSDAPGTSLLEQALSRDLGGAASTQAAAGTMEDQLGNAVERMASSGRVSARQPTSFDPLRRGIDPDAAGRAAQAGVSTWRQQFDDVANHLYGRLGQLLPQDLEVKLPNTYRLLLGEWNEMAGAPALRDAAHQGPSRTYRDALFQDLRDAAAANGAPANLTIDQLLQTQGLPFQAVNAWRQRVGRDIGQAGFGPEAMPDAQLRRLYGALMQDTEGAINQGVQAGTLGAEVPGAFSRAQGYYRAGMGRNEALTPIAEASSPARAYQLIAGPGANVSPNVLRTVRRSIPDQDWDAIAGMKFREMGTPRGQAVDAAGGQPGVWDPPTFLRNWRAMTPASRDALFAGTRYANLQQPLEDLVRVSEAVTRNRSWRNFSNTAYVGAMLGTAGVVGTQVMQGDPGGAARSGAYAVVPTMLAGALLQRPFFVRWLAQGSRAVPHTSTPAVALSQGTAHLDRLLGMAAREDPDAQSQVQVYVDAARRNLEAATAGATGGR